MKIGDGGWKPAPTHFIISTEAMLQLEAHLLQEEEFQFFFCGQVNQDNIESGYSNVRRGRPNTSALDFKVQLRTLTIVGQDVKVANASYRFTEVPSLLQCLLNMDKPRRAIPPAPPSLCLPLLSAS